MEIDSCSEDKLEAYSILFNKCRFSFVSKINMENLKKFSIQNQQKLGKIDIKLNINAIKHLRNNKNISYFLMTQYQQIIPLIYFLRSQPESCRILSTKLMIQTAKIYAQDFYQIAKKMNQVVSTPTYEQESEAYDNYQLYFQVDFAGWVDIFSKEEIYNFAKRCIGLNYGQVFDTERGTLITPYPSGLSVGSAIWLFQNCLTKNNFLWIQGLSHHSWRACQQFNIDPGITEINNIIFTNGTLSYPNSSPNQDQNQCLQFLKAVFQRLSKGNNSKIILQDFLCIPDIINYIAFQFRDKLKKIFFTGASVNKLLSYVNSYPQFLSLNHQRRIYQDPPVYPFETYEQMKERVISEGTLQQISSQKKIPQKQLLLRSTPYIHFSSDFHAYLIDGQNEVVETMYQKLYDLSKLRLYFNSIKIGRITCICKKQQDIKNIPDLGQAFTLHLLQQTIYIQDESNWKYYTAQGIKNQQICKYTKKNGWLRLMPIQQKFRTLNKNWYKILSNEFEKLNIEVLRSQQNSLYTMSTKIWIENYKIFIQSQSQVQLIIIHYVINQNSKICSIQEIIK